MAKRAGYRVIGLPNYVVWHIDTDEKPGNLGYGPSPLAIACIILLVLLVLALAREQFNPTSKFKLTGILLKFGATPRRSQGSLDSRNQGNVKDR